MLTSSSSTSPCTLAPGVSSCMRFKHRSIVLLPQPDGPMMAGTGFAGNNSETARTARSSPNTAGRGAASRRSRALADATIPGPRDPARGQRDDEHEPHQHERRRPREAVPFLERSRRIDIDLERQRLHRLGDVDVEIQVAKCREQQWRRLPRDPRDADEAAGHDAAHGRPRHDLQRRAPARIAERERRLAQRMRDQAHHFFRRAREHRNHQDRERDGAGERREVLLRPDDKRPADDADDDRRRAVQDVGDEPHQPPEASRAVLRQVDSGADANGHADQRRDADDDARADDRVGDAAAGLAGGDGTLREERPVDGRGAFDHEVAEDQEQGESRHERQEDHEPRHDAAGEMTAPRAGAHSARLPIAWPRATRQMRMRAIAFTTTVSTNRISPTSNSADRYRFVVASENSFAIAAAIVYAGWNNETPISWRLPITIVTAIVSPSARPSPRITAPMSPVRPYGSTADRTASQRVAPIASAASRWLPGTASSTSRDTAAMYGTIMIARMIPPASSELP